MAVDSQASLEKAVSVAAEPAPEPVAPTKPPVPDGGLQAWLQVVGAFFLWFNTWGLLGSYGSFQAFYEVEYLQGYTAFQVSTIGSLQSFLLMFLGVFAGPIYDSGYFRHLLLGGSVLLTVGTILQSFCVYFWQLLLVEGFLVGVGCGCLSVLSIAITPLWFTTKLPIANAIAACGSGAGGIVFPIIIRNLLPQIGFAWTVRVIALVILVTLGLANIVLRGPGTAKQRRALIDRASLTDWPYVVFVVACFTILLGIYTPFFYVQSYAITSGVASKDTAFYLVAAMNLSSIPGRVIPAFFAQRLGPMNMIIGTCLCLAGTGIGLIGARTVTTVFVVAVIYGFGTGTFFALQPTIYVRLTSDMKVMGTRFGMAFAVQSLGLLFGSPISGALQRQNGYWSSWVWAGTSVAAGGALIAISRTIKAEKKLLARL
ncbi:MFS general substrate transporter [Thozetella sp. PMI_491]|nr:MFS general substrate transporter [Thozetella sp. PMI_491]